MTTEQATFDVLEDCQDEMERQVAKWGVQHHPDQAPVMLQFIQEAVVKQKERVDRLAAAGKSNWEDIAFEELLEAREAAAAGDKEATYKELIQTAAVLLSWARDVKSRA